MRAVPLLATLPEVCISHLVGVSQLTPFKRDQIICEQGEAGDSLFVIERGNIEIIAPGNGEHVTRLAIMGPGDVFGEQALLDGHPRSATARAMTEGLLLVVPREEFLTVLEQPAALRTMLEVLSERLRTADRLVADHGLANRRLQEESRTDALTGLGNRRKLDEDLRDLQARVERYGHRYAIALGDVDYFKQLNDALGHMAGDEALKRIGQVISQQLRTGDAGYRYGGDEFVIIMPEQTPKMAAVAVERLCEAIREARIEHPENGGLGVVTLSVGVAALPGKASIQSALRGADTAVYLAKRKGRNRVESSE